jgi:hypothetical protein
LKKLMEWKEKERERERERKIESDYCAREL